MIDSNIQSTFFKGVEFMGTTIWVGLLIIVAVVTFFIAVFITKKQFKHDELEEEVAQAKNALEHYRQDVADHLATTNKLMNKMKENYEQLLSHIAKTNHLLLEDRDPKAEEPFFSKETTEQLQASLKEPQVDRSSAQAQPADYVSGESGLFAGQKKPAKQTQ